MRFLLLIPLLASCEQHSPKEVIETTVKPPSFIDVRERLLEASRGTKGFPDGSSTKLMSFSYIGHVTTNQGKMYVVDMNAVLTGMMSPRGGVGKIMFFDSEYRFAGSLESKRYPKPAFCRGDKLYFWGRSKHLNVNSGGELPNGNALDLSRGWNRRKMVDVYEYGSSGGIADRVPNEKFRERERIEWDSKDDIEPTDIELQPLQNKSHKTNG